MRIEVPDLSDSETDVETCDRKLKRYKKDTLLKFVAEVSPRNSTRLEKWKESTIINFLGDTKRRRRMVGKLIMEHEATPEAMLKNLSIEEEEHLYKAIPSIFKPEDPRKLELFTFFLKLLNSVEKNELVALKEQYARKLANVPIEYPDLSRWSE